MTSLLSQPLSRAVFRPQTLGLCLGFSFTSFQLLRQRPMRLDPGNGYSNINQISSRPSTIQSSIDPKTIRQLSTGSVLGLCGGLVVSFFSRPMALLLGLLLVGIQWASSHGINIIPYKRIERYVSGVNFRSVLEENPAFKVSFGITFALAAFVRFPDIQ